MLCCLFFRWIYHLFHMYPQTQVLPKKNTWQILNSTLALSTFKAISQCFHSFSMKKNIFGILTFEFLFEPKRKLQKISGNVPSPTALNGSSPKPPPARYVALNSSQVAANHWFNHQRLKSYKIPTIENTGIDGIDTQHIYIYMKL